MVMNIRRLRILKEFEKYFWIYWTKDLLKQGLLMLLAIPLLTVCLLEEISTVLLVLVKKVLESKLFYLFEFRCSPAILHPLKHRKKLRETIAIMRANYPN